MGATLIVNRGCIVAGTRAIPLVVKREVFEEAISVADEGMITDRMRELIEAGADLIITTGGMSVDPDDVTRFAIMNLGATGVTYGSAVLPGAMVLIAYLSETVNGRSIPVLGIPACALYHKSTVFDLILPRILAGEKIGRKELAEFGHGGLCQNCTDCRYPLCPFGKI
jgi:molybdopterin biosynthesis enzyme